MMRSLFAPLLLALAFLELASAKKFFQKARSETASCSCDCCYTQKTREGEKAFEEKSRVNSRVSLVFNLKCAPPVRESGTNFLQQRKPDECYAETCASDDEESVGEYSSFCFNNCLPVVTDAETAINDSQCLPRAEAAEIAAQAADEDAKNLVTASGGENSVNLVNAGGKVSAKEKMIQTAMEPPIAVVQGDMMQAYTYAKQAGEAAMHAKHTYELLLGSVQASAEAAGLAVVDELKREGREQATRAVKIRQKYEAAAQKTAQNNAVGIAKVYKKALLTAQATAGMWDLRSNEYATAAAQRKGMAKEFEARAGAWQHEGEQGEARKAMESAHQAMDQANQFAEKSASAHVEANKLAKTLPWYANAEVRAAANALVGSMPPDVPPPVMPALP